ncbi:helix-turn-helix transcriptional regulator [Roseivirga sp. UBA1976]|uniref:response regulator transcription factor n=1 Tax=Roseivirga sp. UBA1976 TaxID=1947386 RepID=UPI00257DF53A|nr:helix-turn-helix transcriptional regulator [Roseivirga sp. UBA1976]MEC7756165.1 helix-turn-helix transcriptional regulator [Bacteroidota bacterium]|tara:strand:- start:6764 stop:7462 length:699 start_codon:yes stop_codon:yes gene_type:complete
MHLTEKEAEITNHIYLDKMRRLYLKNKRHFDQVVEYLPIPVVKSDVKSWDFTQINDSAQCMLGLEREYVLDNGSKATTSLVQPENIPVIRKYLSSRNFNDSGDKVIPYFQNARLFNKEEYIWTLTYKIFLNENEYFSLYQPMHDFRVVAPTLIKHLGDTVMDMESYNRFHSLTRREKEILKNVASGSSNKEIGESLFISEHTVRTHRNNIWRKLNISHIKDAIRFAGLFELQ